MDAVELAAMSVLAKLWGKLDNFWESFKGKNRRKAIKELVDWFLNRHRNLTDEQKAVLPGLVNEQLKAKRAGKKIQDTGLPPIVPNIPLATFREQPNEARYRTRVRIEIRDPDTDERWTIIVYVFTDKPPTREEVMADLPMINPDEPPGGSPPPPGWTHRRLERGRVWIEGIDRAT